MFISFEIQSTLETFTNVSNLTIYTVTKRIENFYNNFSFFYPIVDIFLKPQKSKLCSEINSLPPGLLLEIGVGNGSHLHLYQKHEITGIDTSRNMLDTAKKYRNKNIELLQMNGENLQFQDASFDYAVLSHVIAVANNPEKVLEETYRVLKPDGKIFILNHFTPDNGLKHFDKAFDRVAKLFHFRSLFYINGLTSIKKFTLLKEIKFGRFAYFKLLIYSKT